ncbi:MAG: hypothetical protein ACI9OJ_004288 [Myxococcota bacterium]|jgi:hypothetical protein
MRLKVWLSCWSLLLYLVVASPGAVVAQDLVLTNARIVDPRSTAVVNYPAIEPPQGVPLQ